ncbi:large subunit ribosomal protein L46 [Marchantia polymorpha subsp. ruderalis]|uniref:Ribosomal protein L46 N-terminal domain-containing protein n=1 Tax=Marchantia polymorpha TaxID=3197 RepID=A0A2R6XBB8_MARPO|nr:hypothetical protein MARPO_0025s0100 [Marchantia polymorpha]BBN03716.1 hypothetical protein Mp_2g25780 [Marchantia polymorpha subsp. ruderalis]|eukprot:PTQ43416.1 hypothetical protein MARPO_0025s0100 [Marchantia polymorpha]
MVAEQQMAKLLGSSARRLVGGSLRQDVVGIWKGARRGLSSSVAALDASGAEEKIVAAVVLERLPVVLPPVPPAVSEFKSFSFEWQQQYRRHYPQEFLDASANRGEDDEIGVYEPAPTITEADQTNDQRSLKRAYEKRLYLIVRGKPFGKSQGEPVWHFPEKEYAKEPSLRQCAELALGPIVEDIPKSVYFVGNAPCGFLPSETPAFKKFFFKSQLLVNDLPLADLKKYEDFAWISKHELSDYFEPAEAEYLNKMLQ